MFAAQARREIGIGKARREIGIGKARREIGTKICVAVPQAVDGEAAKVKIPVRKG